MHNEPLLLICTDDDAPAAEALVHATLAGWPDGDPPTAPPTLRRLSPLDVADPALRRADAGAVWLYAGDGFGRSQLYRCLDDLEEWRTPTMLTRIGERGEIGDTFRDGVAIAPPHADPAHLRLLLRSLMCQGELIRGLKQEMALLNRHQHGLSSAIHQLDEELRLAARTQRQFLPQQLPQLNGASCHVLFRPAGYVSGDIYDAQRLDEHHIGFYIADAVGHGVPAALLTMFVHQALRTREVIDGRHRIIPPDEALARLNSDMFSRQGASSQFVTACYGTLDCRTGELSIARGGHPAPLLLRQTGEIERLEPEGPLLGVFDEAEFDLMRTTVEPGDRLLIYSDGFELAFGDNDTPFSNSYVHELHKLREGPLDRALRDLEHKLDQQVGSLHQRDDLTALMIEVGETEGSTRGDRSESRSEELVVK